MRSIKMLNDVEYAIVQEKTINDILYTLFANVNDPSDLCFRKTVKENDEEFYVNLDDEDEVKRVLVEFIK